MKRLLVVAFVSAACGDVATRIESSVGPVEPGLPVAPTPTPLPVKPNPFTSTRCLETQSRISLPDAVVGCGTSKVDITITNRCDFAVHVSSTRTNAFGFITLPRELAPFASGPATLGFLPISAGGASGRVVLRALADGHTQESSIALEGTSTRARFESLEKVVALFPPVDLLLIIDDDGVFAAETNFASMARYLQSAGNFRVVVSNLSGGVQRPDGVDLLLSESPQFFDRLVRATRVSRTSGPRGCHDAVQRLRAAQEPTGFWSDSRPPAVICISNEIDQSDVAGSVMVAAWQRRDGPPSTMFNLVAPFSGECGQSDPRLLPIVALTGGIREELCQPNWASSIQSLGRTLLGHRTWFHLPPAPLMVPNSLEVSVDGLAVSKTAWTYDGAAGAVVFGPQFAPSPGQRLRATWQTCEAP